MTYELVELTRLGKSAAKLPAGQDALSSEEDEDRGHDRQVREQRVDVAEDAFAFALRDDVGDAREHGVHHVKRRGVEMRRTRGEFAQHDRREPRPGGRFFDERADPRVEFVFG